VINNAQKPEHYNLYYIFKEDKDKNQLSQVEAMTIWKFVIKSLYKKPK